MFTSSLKEKAKWHCAPCGETKACGNTSDQMKPLVARSVLYIYIYRAKNSRPIRKETVHTNKPIIRDKIWIHCLGGLWLVKGDIICARAGSWNAIGAVLGKKRHAVTGFVGGVKASRLRGLNKGSLTESGDPRWGSSLHFTPPLIRSRPMWEICAVCLDETQRQGLLQDLLQLQGRQFFSFFPPSLPVCVCVSLSLTRSGFAMDVLPMCSIFQELQIVHDTGYFSALPSLEEYWQQVKKKITKTQTNNNKKTCMP